jgi:hypothetical protein
LKALKSLHDGDYLFYADGDSYYEHSVNPLVEILNSLSQPILPFVAGYGIKERYCTKRDLFIRMNLDIPEITDSWYVLSDFILVKKCAAAIDFFEEWLALTQTDDLVTDAPSELAKDYDELLWHYHIGSIFSLLVKKHRFKRFPDPTDSADEWKLVWTRLGVPQEAYVSNFDKKIERTYPRILTVDWGLDPFEHWVRTEMLNPKT